LFNAGTDRQRERERERERERDRQTDSRTDITKLTVTFQDYFYEGVEKTKVIRNKLFKATTVQIFTYA
jgi:hypothetical protein